MTRKVTRRDFLKIGAVSAGGLGLAACGVKATPEAVATQAPAAAVTAATSAGGIPNAVRIGVIQPMSGAASLFGTMMRPVYQYAVEKINSEGGIKSLGGAPLELVWADHQNKQDLAVNETERLIQQEKVSVMMGASTSGTTMAATTATDRLEVPFVVDVPAASNITLRGLKWLFRTNIIGYQYGQLFAEFCQYANKEYNAGLQRMAFIYPDSEAARSFLGAAAEESKKVGFDVVVDEAFPGDTQDFTTMLTRAKIQKPDVLCINDASLATAVVFVKQCAAVGLDLKYFTSSNGSSEFQDMADGLGPLKDGYSFMAQWNPDVPGGKALYDDVLAKTDNRLTGFTTLGIQAVYVVAEALEKASSRDPKDIRDALASLEIKPGPRLVMPWEYIKFDETGQNTGAKCIMIQWFGDEKLTTYPTHIATHTPAVPFEYFKQK